MPDLNPEFTAERTAQFIVGTFPGDMKIEPVEIGADRSVGRITVEQIHLHPGGFVHGGVWVALADSVAAWGTFRNLPPGWNFTTIELKINVMAAGVMGDVLEAIATPLHTGSRTQVWEVRVMKAERLAANFIATQMVLPPPSGE
jgi:uncharacterized protein (TIGR00369 family)